MAGSGQCKLCPVNHVTFITGAISVDQCTGKRMNMCVCVCHKIYCILELCPVNHNSSNGLMPCRPCPKDTYQPTPGQIECLPCTSESDSILCSKS